MLNFSFEASAQVNANFSASPIAGCSPLQVNFTDLSTGNPTSWNWNFGNGAAPSTLQNPSAFYLVPGVYTVTLTVTGGAFSDTEIKTNYILVYNKPQAGFTISTDTACVGETITFTDASIISPGGSAIGTWAWDFGDGNSSSSTVSSITHAYTNPGNYPISLIVTDINGCSGMVITKNIVIVPKPTVAFAASTTLACAPPLNVTFTNTSTTVGTTTYSWNFGDGNTSTGPNPSHTYTAFGIYDVTLIVNQNGCIDSLTKPNYITIQDIAASFIATPTVICTGDSITFINTSIPPAILSNWDFGDGNTSILTHPTNVYSTGGTYTVTLIASDVNGCIDTTTETVTVNQTPVANFIADTTIACSVPLTVNFTNTSVAATNYLWDFGDGNTSNLQNPVHTYTSFGQYNVSLIAINATGPCADTIVYNQFIDIAAPVAMFLYPPDSGCVPLTINFQNTSTSPVDPVTNYIWDFGDGNTTSTASGLISHTYTATGIYTASMIIQTSKGCSDTAICVNCIKVGTAPMADFGIVEDTVCYGFPITFLNLSTGYTGLLWNFGDGQVSMAPNPIHIYGDTGNFQVTLYAFNNGCPDTSIIQNVVVLPPKAEFTFTLSCTNYYTVEFTSTSDGADSLVWNFGDGALDTMNTLNPVHTYSSRGPITVTLTAYNYSTGCFNTTSGSFTIAEPIASFTVATPTGCYPFIADFTSTSQDGSITQWNFGDPSTNADSSLLIAPSYTYAATGQYPVMLVISDINGCIDTVIDTVSALGPYPDFIADTLTGCRPLMVTFVDASVSDSTITQWTWDFGDGSPIIITNNDSIVHTYTTTGTYSLTMTVKDTNGCVKTIIKNNYIQATFPFPAFTVDTFACKSDILTYDASATNVVGGTYIWNYGDGNSDTTNNPIITHTYTNDGFYTVSLTVIDINGCDSTITDTIRILKPTANFGWKVDTMYCGNMLVSFTDSSLGYVTSWNWNFGNGGTSTLQNPTALYSTGGVYSVSLIVTNAGGCKDTFQLDSIITVPFAVGNFTITPDSGCNPLTVCFTTNAQNTISYIWDFGDGNVVTSMGDTCHTYTNAGTFNPLLLLQYNLPTGAPCIQQALNLTGLVTVTNVINISLNVPSVLTLPEDSIISVTAIYNGGMPPYTYQWKPDTAISCDSCPSILIIGTGDTILYTFTIYDAAGCIGIDSILILSEPCFEENLIPNVFSPNEDGLNDIFYVRGICPNEKYSVQIYDRWGTLIFSTTQRKNSWDGRTNAGVAAKDGVYYYLIQAGDNTYKGFVHLMR